MDVARLPFEIGELFGEVDGVLAGPTRHLQHETACRQPLTQHLGDRLTIAERRRCRTRGACGTGFVETPTVRHEARPRASSSSRVARKYISTRVRVNMPSAKAISGSVSMAGLIPSEPRMLRPIARTAIRMT